MNTIENIESSITIALRNLRNRSVKIEDADQVFQKFAMIVSGTLPITFLTEENVREKIWAAEIEKDEELILFLVEASAYLRFSSGFSEFNYSAIIDQLSDGYTTFCSAKSKIVGDVFLQRSIMNDQQTVTDFKTMLMNNSWLVVLLLGKFIDIKRLAKEVFINEPRELQ